MSRRLRISASFSLLALAGPVLADCPPLGTLPGYELDQQVLHAYDQRVFRVGDADDLLEERKVRGATCEATYLFQGDEPMSALEIQYNYREQLGAMGATFTYTEGNDTHGHVDHGGVRTWFHVYSEDERIDLTVVEVRKHRPTLLSPAGEDHPLFGRLPGFDPESAERRGFDEASFRVATDTEGNTEDVAVQGARHYVRYYLREGGQPVGPVDVLENYRHAAVTLGAEVMLEDDANLTARFLHESKVTWLGVYAEDQMYEVTVVEEKPFASSLQVPEPNALRAALEADGRVALYVQFDFGKATLRPDAAPVIERVVALLHEDPALSLLIEGHTDDVGDEAANLALSKARARAVVAALVAQGIAGDRLAAEGHGEGRPVADNTSSGGRAKNRRVELVKR